MDRDIKAGDYLVFLEKKTVLKAAFNCTDRKTKDLYRPATAMEIFFYNHFGIRAIPDDRENFDKALGSKSFFIERYLFNEDKSQMRRFKNISLAAPFSTHSSWSGTASFNDGYLYDALKGEPHCSSTDYFTKRNQDYTYFNKQYGLDFLRYLEIIYLLTPVKESQAGINSPKSITNGKSNQLHSEETTVSVGSGKSGTAIRCRTEPTSVRGRYTGHQTRGKRSGAKIERSKIRRNALFLGNS